MVVAGSHRPNNFGDGILRGEASQRARPEVLVLDASVLTTEVPADSVSRRPR